MFSVGILYSSQTLLELVEKGELTVANFEHDFKRIEVADGPTVLDLSQKCRWIRLEEGGSLCLTERGVALRSVGTAEFCLREQLLDVISHSPPAWSKKIPLGRSEALKIMPDEAKQCFRECGLTQGIEEDVVSWWDQAGQSVRAVRSKTNHDVGRQAEKNSVDFERRRTGKEPLWQAIETNVAGYDVLSFLDSESTERTQIEVKGSGMRKSEAAFFLTRNEWRTAMKSKHYIFHLWLIHEVPKLFVVPAKAVEPFVPENRLSGKWETAQLSFKEFDSFACDLP
ncbi:MAG: DUF3883 domain-containing protein [Paracoccaceae bacterium]|nr:DUF3883 domain-containing protein [Paracoccaceae bacterium]